MQQFSREIEDFSTANDLPSKKILNSIRIRESP